MARAAVGVEVPLTSMGEQLQRSAAALLHGAPPLAEVLEGHLPPVGDRLGQRRQLGWPVDVGVDLALHIPILSARGFRDDPLQLGQRGPQRSPGGGTKKLCGRAKGSRLRRR